MKKLSILALVFISLSVSAQKKTITITLDEQQMVSIYTLFNSAKAGIFDSDQLTAKQAKGLAIFADSLNAVFVEQSKKWHPEPVRQKVDSTQKK